MTATPPATTLSTPSPTEQNPEHHQSDDEIPSASALTAMNSALLKRPLYLIVATSVNPPLGIGLKGQLPWPQIKSDMAYFRKATTGTGHSPTSSSPLKNAVVMGRKTYESIPPKFRPLSNRVNIVLTRTDVKKFADRVVRELTRNADDDDDGADRSEYRIEDQETVHGLPGEIVSVVRRDEEQPTVVVTADLEQALGVVKVADVFCIGGAEVYGLVLGSEKLKRGWRPLRVLQTKVRKLDGGGDGEEFECDTFWPGKGLEDGVDGWKSVGKEEIEREWTKGVVGVPQGDEEWKRDEKAGVEVQVVGWEREG